jgi:DNA-binding response OmpR family regulator
MEKQHILVIDDDQVARMLILKVLTMRGYEAVAAEDGAQGFAQLEKRRWDAVILDLDLPDIQGLNLLKHLFEQKPDLKIIILTKHGTLDSAIQALRFKAVDYLLKPATPGDILKSVEKACKLGTGSEKDLTASLTGIPTSKKQQVIKLTKTVRYDYNRRKIEDGEKLVYLTSTENNIFKFLLDKHHEVITHTELVENAHGYQVDKDEAARILRPVICRLRIKLEKISGGKNWLQNVRGSGYLLEIQRD